MRSSQAAFDLIVREEDSDEAYYTRHYEHFDWPAGASGPTVGIGVDLGYETAAEVKEKWAGIVPDSTIAIMLTAIGLKGEAAHAFVRRHGNAVTITWDQAIAEFQRGELPHWEALVERELPNTEALSGDSFGSLVSLAYNRGASFSLPGPRYSEMRAIKAHMEAKEFDKIPGEFLAMRRLWPWGGDLWNRRGHEAALFKQGLKVLPTANTD